MGVRGLLCHLVPRIFHSATSKAASSTPPPAGIATSSAAEELSKVVEGRAAAAKTFAEAKKIAYEVTPDSAQLASLLQKRSDGWWVQIPDDLAVCVPIFTTDSSRMKGSVRQRLSTLTLWNRNAKDALKLHAQWFDGSVTASEEYAAWGNVPQDIRDALSPKAQTLLRAALFMPEGGRIVELDERGRADYWYLDR